MNTLPKQPPLPEPTIVDNRRLFTTGDIRKFAHDYGQQCFAAGMRHDPFESSIAPEQPGKYSRAFEDLFPWIKK